MNALANLKMMLEVKDDPKTAFDYQLLECLRECSEESMSEYGSVLEQIEEAKTKNNEEFGTLFQAHDYHFYCGVMAFYDKQYELAGQQFRTSLAIMEQQPPSIQDEQFNY